MQSDALRVCSNVQHPEGCRAVLHLPYVQACTFGVLLRRMVAVVLAKPHTGTVCGEAWLGLQPASPELGVPRDHHECIHVCALLSVSTRRCALTERLAKRLKARFFTLSQVLVGFRKLNLRSNDAFPPCSPPGQTFMKI